MNTNLIKKTFILSIGLFSNFVFADDFQNCLNKLKGEILKSGVSIETFNTYANNLSPDMSIPPKLDTQPEFKTPIWDYISNLVDDSRIESGISLLSQYRPILNTVSEQYLIPPEVIVAVWGVESNFGKNFGKFPLVQSLGTLSCYGRRQDYFKTEFFSALRIVQSGDIKYEELKGSWAGAFGHTQFMPSTFEKTAVDFDGDGKRDLINNIPDALASTANFLKKAGWDNNKSWGYEVKLPPNFDNSNDGRKIKRDITYWNKKGLSLIDGSKLPNDIPETGLLTVSGVNGPAFLVTKNFDAIYKYNAAESYALAIAHLSDRIKGGSPFMTPWPTDDGPLSKIEKLELQNILIQKGYPLGDVTGEIGPKTKAAIKNEQIKLGIESNGRAGQKIFLLLGKKNNLSE